MPGLFRSPSSVRTLVPASLAFLLSAAGYAGVNYYYLDLNGNASGFGTLNASWDTTSAVWTLSTAGTATPTAHTFTSDRIYISASGWDYDVAVFGAGSTVGVLTIADGQKVELFGLVDNVGQTIAATGTGYISLRGSPPSGITIASGVSSLISAPVVIDTNNDTKFTVNGILSMTGSLTSNGTGALTKEGTGTLILSGAGSYSGDFKINKGTLRLTSQAAVSGSPYTISAGGALELQGGIALGTANTYSDGVASAGAIVSLSGANQISTVNLTFSPNKISVAAGSVLSIGAVTGSTTYDLLVGGDGDVVISSGVRVAILNKFGSGNLTLSPGGTSIVASGLGIIGGTLTATTSSLPSASISLNGGDLVILQDFDGTIARQLTGTGRLIKSGSGVLTISRSDNSFSGGVVVNAGKLKAGAAGALPYSIPAFIASGATLDLNGYAATLGSLSGAGNVQLGAVNLSLYGSTSTQQFSGVISGSGAVSLDSPYRQVLSGNNTFSGGLSILWGGTLEVASASSLGSANLTISGGALATTATFSTAKSIALATYPSSSGTIDVLDTTTLGWSGVISGGGALVKAGAGTLTLSGANNYTGTTTVAAGVIETTSSTALGTGSVVVNQDAVLRLKSTIANQVTMENGGTLSGNGSAGSVTLKSGGFIGPGDGLGAMTVASAAFKGGSNYVWQVGDANGAAGSGYDTLLVNGTADFSQAGVVGGKVNLKLVSLGAGQLSGNSASFSRAQIKSFTVMDATSFSFGSNANLSDIFNIDLSGFRYEDGTTTSSDLWSLQYDATNTAIVLTAIPEPSSYGLALGALALCVGVSSRRRRKCL